MKALVDGVEMFVYDVDWYGYDDSERILMAHAEDLTLEDVVRRCNEPVITSMQPPIPTREDLTRIGFVLIEEPASIALWKMRK